MARKKGMMGRGSAKMGGGGIKPSTPPTALAGRPSLGAPSGLPGAGGMPGGAPRSLPAPGGQPIARSPAASIGGSAGFNKGGAVAEGIKEERAEKKMGLKRGGAVDAPTAFNKGGEVKGRVARDTAKAGKAC